VASSAPPPPPPQQPPWQPPGPPQQPPWPPPKPRSNNRPLIIALAISLPALLLIVLVAVVASSSGDDSDDPNSVAEAFVDAINTGDAAAAEAVLCDGAMLTPGSVDEIIAGEPDVRLAEPLEDYVPDMAGSDSTSLEGTLAGEPAVGDIWVGQSEDDGPWCVMSAMVLPDPGF